MPVPRIGADDLPLNTWNFNFQTGIVFRRKITRTIFEITGAKMKKEYVTWFDDPPGLPEGEEVKLTIRDLTPGREKYQARHVRAILSRSPGKLPEADTLWIRSGAGAMKPDPWSIKVTEDLGEYLHGTPYHEILSP